MKRLLLERDFELQHRPRGEGGDDFTATDPHGKVWSVEVKHTQNLMLTACLQCRKNANGKPRMLIWKPSHWNLPGNTFVVFVWDGADASVHVWRSVA